jgi:hypothetical protein
MGMSERVRPGQTAANITPDALPQVTVRLLPAEMAPLKRYSPDHERKVTQVVHEAIREYLDRRQPWA